MRAVVLFLVAALALDACAGSGGSTSPSVEPVRVEVALTDTLKMDPPSVTVPAGVPVTFVVTNTGKGPHEFVLGDEAAQAEHEREMRASNGQMTHDHGSSLSLQPGETKELTQTFAAPGVTYAGCHQPKHYDFGMRMTIGVE